LRLEGKEGKPANPDQFMMMMMMIT